MTGAFDSSGSIRPVTRGCDPRRRRNPLLRLETHNGSSLAWRAQHAQPVPRQTINYDGPTRRTPSSSRLPSGGSTSCSERQAIKYGVGVGRDGFTWSGTISSAAWTNGQAGHAACHAPPPAGSSVHGWRAEQSARARAMYIGSTLYRIHARTNLVDCQAVSSGGIRMFNDDVIHLYGQ